MGKKGNLYKALIYLSLIAFLWPLLQEYGELSLLDFAYASIILAIILLLQLLILVILEILNFVLNKAELINKKYNPLEAMQSFMSASFIALNVYYFLFTLLPMQPKIETFIALALIPVFFYFLRNPARLKQVYIFSSIFLALSAFQFGFSYLTGNSSIKEKAPDWDLSRYKSLEALKEAQDKRNIYLISFDAVASPESLKRFYGINTAEHFEYLESAGFKVLDSAFSGGLNTRLSFFNMLNLGEKTELVPAFFSTKSLNPSYILLEKAGYKIQFLFRGNYMGSNTGTLDYFYPEKTFITLCDFIDQQYGYIACNPGINQRIIEKNFTPVPSIDDFIEILNRRVVLTNDDEGTWITLAHIWFPGHAPHDFLYSNSDAKKLFLEKTINSYPKLTEMIKDIVETILASDDNPIIIIYSDHGAWLTKGLDYNEVNTLYSSDEIFLEKNGVLFSVYPSDFCVSKFNDGYNTINLIPDLLECENQN